MKTRNGFISNSSSSSFVVVFPKELPKTVAEMEKLLFGDSLYVGYENEYSTKEIAVIVMRDMEDGPIKNRKTLNEALRSGTLCASSLARANGFSDVPRESISSAAFKSQTSLREALDIRNKKQMDSAEEVIKKILHFTKLKQLYYFHYADNEGGYGGFMEHGEIFSNLVHFRMNQH